MKQKSKNQLKNYAFFGMGVIPIIVLIFWLYLIIPMKILSSTDIIIFGGIILAMVFSQIAVYNKIK